MLNQRQILFCEAILTGEAGANAYDQAGYSCNSREASKNGASKLLKNEEVLQYLAMRRREHQERTNVTAERTILELRRLAFSDVRELMSWDDKGIVFVPSVNLTQDQASSIASIKSRRRIRRDGGEDGGETETLEMEVKVHPKLDAIEKLAKIQGLYQADRMNDADVQRDLLKTVLWRYVFAVHVNEGISVQEALTKAEKNPEEVERWGKEVMLKPGSLSS